MLQKKHNIFVIHKIIRILGSGGFAIVNPDSSMQITAIEAAPLDQLDPTVIKI